MKKATHEINSLIVMNHNEDATLYRVTEINGNMVGVIDGSIEDERPNQTIQWIDRSLALSPNRAQLAAHNG